MSVMGRLARREVVAARGRLSLTVVTVGLGVGFVVASGVVGATVEVALASPAEAITRDVDIMVASSAFVGGFDPSVPPLDRDDIARIAATDGVAAVAPEVTVPVVVTRDDGSSLDGRTPAASPPLTWTPEVPGPVDIVSGDAPTERGDVLLDRATVDRAGLALGDPVVVSSSVTEMAGRLTGVVTLDGQDGLRDAPVPVLLWEDSQTLSGREGADLVRVVAEDGADREALVETLRIETESGRDRFAGTVEEYRAERAAWDGFVAQLVRYVLLGFALVAALVGTFLVANTFAMVMSQRRRQFALLRAVGATRRQLRRSVVREALLVSAAGSAVGVVAGIGMGWLLLRGVAALGIGVPVGLVRVDWWFVVLGVGIGLILGVVAARLAVRRSLRVAPVEALREADAEPAGRGRMVVRGLLGAGLGVAAVALVGWGASADSTVFGAVLAVLALVVLNRALVPLLTPVVHRLLPGRGVVADIARRSTARDPRRVAGTTNALVVGLTVVITAATLGASLVASARESSDGLLRNVDAVVGTGAGGAVISTSTRLSPDLTERIGARPEVASVAGVAYEFVEFGDAAVDASRVTAGADAVLSPEVQAGRAPGALADDEVAVSVARADSLGLALGDDVRIGRFGEPSRTFTVAGLYEGSDTLFDAVLPDGVFDGALYADPGYDRLFVTGVDGAAAEDVVATVDEVVNPAQGTVQTVDDFVDSGLGAIGQILAVIAVLLAITLLIALIGIVNTTVLSTLQRTREFGLLRAVGATRGQLRSVVRRETLAITLYGTLLGVGGGVAVGLGLAGRLRDQGVGQLAVPWGQIVAVAVISIVAGVAAAYLPGRRASRMDVLEALRPA